MLAPALQWGLFFVRIALATQGNLTITPLYVTLIDFIANHCLVLLLHPGLGGVVPQLDLLSGIDGDAIESMSTQILGNANSLGSYADDADTSILHYAHCNEENAKAFSYVFELISYVEGGGGTGWTPKLTGLHLTDAPRGKGRSMWVSIDGIEQYQMHGEDAINKIGGGK